MPDLMTPEQFAQKIKAQYPVYANIPDAELAAKMIEKYPVYRSQIAEAAPAAAPKTTGSGLGVMESAFQTAKDFGAGALKGAAHTALDLGEAMHAIPYVSTAVDTLYGTPGLSKGAFEQARKDTAYTNTTQRVGGAAETVGELLVPVGEAAKAVPTAARAGAKFLSVAARANTLPVDVAEAGNIALRINQLAERGTTMPSPVRKFLLRITDPDKGQMTYEEGRDFATAIGKLSVNEAQRLTPVVAREVASLSAAINKMNAGAAIRAGKGAEYVQAMNQYAKAMRIRNTVHAALEGAKKAVPYATAGGATYYLTKQLQDLFTGGD